MEKYTQNLPPETKNSLNDFWSSLSAVQQKDIESMLDSIPSQNNLFKLMLKQSVTQLKYTFGQKHRISIVGPANVGKSTLFNQFIQNTESFAEVSPIPGTTKEIQESNAGLFSIIDTPGTDAVGDLGENEKQIALDAGKNSDVLIIVFDAMQGIKKNDLEIFSQLKNFNVPYIVVLNKIDLIKKDNDLILEKTAKNLGLEKEEIIPISAKNNTNISEILKAIVLAEPGIISALGKTLPLYRWQLAWRTIVSAASTAGVIALTPLPIIDFVPLITLQTTMVLGIAKIYNYEINFKRAQELLAAFGLGFLGRTLFMEISKLGGVPGWVLSAAIAASTTVVMGIAAANWFEKGEKFTRKKINLLSKQLTENLISQIKQIRKPGRNKKKLRDIIEDSLQDMPVNISTDDEEIEI